MLCSDEGSTYLVKTQVRKNQKALPMNDSPQGRNHKREKTGVTAVQITWFMCTNADPDF